MVLGRLIRFSSKNVFTNLAAEEIIFQRTSGRSLLFYVNAESVVLGRTQNPLNEADVAYAAANSIPIARRRSGGGTVVHDQGNLNFCFMRPRTEHEPLANAKLVASVIRDEFGIKAEVNGRADILVDGKKVSGAAYRISRDRAYHHGTLLVDANLDRLRRLLKSPLSNELQAMGTKSVPSPVTRLVDHSTGKITVNDVIDAIAERFSRTNPNVQSLSATQVERDCGGMQAERGELCSHAWVYGQTPRFSYKYRLGDLTLQFQVAKGAIIADVVVDQWGSYADKSIEQDVEILKSAMIGQPFDGPTLALSLASQKRDGWLGALASALRVDLPGQFWRDDSEAVSQAYS